MKSITTLILSLMLTACSSATVDETIAEIAIEALTNVEVSYNAAQCPIIKNSCTVNGNYEEWYQENGQLACACNN